MKKLAIAGGIAVIVFGIALGFSGCRNINTSLPKDITLDFWGVWDESADIQPIITKYKRRHPHITVRYRKLRAEEYEDALLRGWAKGEGPDIFQVHNTWVGKYLEEGWLGAAPKSTKATFVSTTRNALNQVSQTVETVDTAFYTTDELRRTFVDVVVQDVLRTPRGKMQQGIYGLPLSVDTLALYANTDILNRANIAFPPATWEEFISAVSATVVSDDQGTVVQAGAPLGATSENMENAQDVLALLMMQNGASMLSANNQQATFQSPDINGIPVGELALTFYTDFANPGKAVYTWNDSLPDAFELFLQGKLAFFLGYSYHLPRADAAVSVPNYTVTPVPQIDPQAVNQMTFANYWVNGVFANSEHANEAWNFLQFATGTEQIAEYITTSRRPPARRDLIEKVSGDPSLEVFTDQVIPSRSWYRGRSPESAESIFDEMITRVVSGERTPAEAISQAAQQINLTL